MIDRMLGHWKTTGGGVALSAIGLYVLNSWNCQIPSGIVGWAAWGSVAGPAILGMLAKDH
jgi:hypothetical protein